MKKTQKQKQNKKQQNSNKNKQMVVYKPPKQQKQKLQQGIDLLSPITTGISDIFSPLLTQPVEKISKGISNLFGKIFGNGDYTVNYNTITQGNVPNFVTSNNNSIRVSETEYITDIVVASTNAFTIVGTHSVNPANPFLFPKLSKQCADFTKYKFHGLLFYFKSLSSSSSVLNQTTVGDLLVSTQYNTYDDTFVNASEMLNTQFNTNSKVTLDAMHPIECKPRDLSIDTLNIRNNGTYSSTADGDGRFYDWCKTTIAYDGVPATGKIYRMYCTYDVELLNSTLKDNSMESTVASATTGISTSAYFGTNLTKTTVFDNIYPMITYGTTTVVFQNNVIGTYLINYTVLGDSTAIVGPTITPSGNASNALVLPGGTYYVTNSGSTTTQLMHQQAIKLIGGGTLTFSGATLPANATLMSLSIFPYVTG